MKLVVVCSLLLGAFACGGGASVRDGAIAEDGSRTGTAGSGAGGAATAGSNLGGSGGSSSGGGTAGIGGAAGASGTSGADSGVDAGSCPEGASCLVSVGLIHEGICHAGECCGGCWDGVVCHYEGPPGSPCPMPSTPGGRACLTCAPTLSCVRVASGPRMGDFYCGP